MKLHLRALLFSSLSLFLSLPLSPILSSTFFFFPSTMALPRLLVASARRSLLSSSPRCDALFGRPTSIAAAASLAVAPTLSTTSSSFSSLAAALDTSLPLADASSTLGAHGAHPGSPSFEANARAMSELVAEVRRLQREAAEGGGPEAVRRHRSRGKWLARERIDAVLDPGSPFLELSALAGHGLYCKSVEEEVEGWKREAAREKRIVDCSLADGDGKRKKKKNPQKTRGRPTPFNLDLFNLSHSKKKNHAQPPSPSPAAASSPASAASQASSSPSPPTTPRSEVAPTTRSP